MALKSSSVVAVVITTLSVVSCSSDPQVVAREFVERGDRYAADKNYEAAIIEYRNAVQHEPRAGEVHRKLAAAYLSRGEGGEALRSAVTAAELLPDVAEAQVEAGSLLLLAGKFTEAKTIADKILASNPNDVRGRLLLGNATAGLKDLDAGIKEFEEALRLDANQAGIYTGLASLKASRGDQAEAERIFNQAIGVDPKSISARLALAHFLWTNDRVPEAEAAMKAAHQLKPTDARTNVTLALFYQATRRRAEAEPHLKAAARNGDEPRLTLLLADYYIGMNRGADAAALLEPLATDGRFGTLVNMRLAGLAQLQGASDQAITIIDRAIAADPKNSRAMAAKSDLLLRQNKLDEAATAAEAAVTANASSADAQFVRGRVLAAKGRHEEAEKAFNDVLRLNPRAAAARVELARLRIRRGASDAVDVAADAAKADPRSVDARLTLARALMAKRDLAGAETVMKQVVAVVPDAAPVHAQHGTLLGLKKDLAGARAAFTRALAIDPVQLEAIAGLTTLDFAAGLKPEALKRLNDLVARVPQNSRLLLIAAGANASAGQLDRSEALLLTIIETDPGVMEAYSMLGRIYLSQKRLAAARTQFEAVAARHERPVGALTLLGTINMLENRTPEAQQAFERVLKVDPKAGVAANNLAWIYLENGGSIDMALHLAEVAQSGLPNVAEVSDTLGWAYYKRGQVAEAITALKRSLRLDSKNTTTLYHLALAHEKGGEMEEAKKALSLYLRLDPSSARSADVRRRLETLGH